MLNGCEDFERGWHMKQLLDPTFRVGQRANKKDFEELIHAIDINSVDGCYNTHEHPSLNFDLKKGDKLHFKGVKVAYMTFRFETEEGIDVNPFDVVGNVFVHKIVHRFIDINWAALKSTMYEYVSYIDRYGNTWEEENEDGDVFLSKLAPENWFIMDLLNKPTTEYENNFDQESYNIWKEKEGEIKHLYKIRFEPDPII